MKAPNNPFILTGFHSKKYFCDRKKELASCHENFENGRNLVLYSWRRLGKTSLIRCFLWELEKQKKGKTVYVDLLGTQNMEEALKQITQSVYDRFGKVSGNFSTGFQKLLGSIGAEVSFDPLTGLPTFGFGLRTAPDPKSSLTALGKFLTDQTEVLVVLDEFQQIVHYPGANAEAHFRNWMQQFPGIRFLYSGSHRHMMVSMFTEKNRPFYQSSELLKLAPIEPKPYRKFVGKHFESAGKSMEERIFDEIYAWSRGQTYCIQLIWNKLFGRYDTIREIHIKETWDEILEQESPIFANYMKLLSAMQWRLLKAIAMEEPLTGPLSQKFISKHRLGATSSVETALKSLVKKELVIEDNGAWLIHDVLLARWLQRL